MHYRKFIGLSLSLITASVFANPVKLLNYSDIQKSLLEGYSVKAVVDLKQCVLMHDHTDPNAPGTVLNTFGLTFTDFVIKENSKNLIFAQNYMNAPMKNIPANYTDNEFEITPRGQINLTMSIVEFEDYKNIKFTKFICFFDKPEKEGVKFYRV